MSNANKSLCRRFFEDVWNNRNMAVIDELFADDFVRHAGSEPEFGAGPGSVRNLLNHYSSAFPDTRFTIEDIVAEGDKVVVRWTARGTHQGHLEDIPPSGKPVTVAGTSVVRIANGKMAEVWDNFDALGMLQQIGAVPGRSAGRAGGVA
jgi:steroid delta-isomerase-like uncharacterized protein